MVAKVEERGDERRENTYRIRIQRLEQIDRSIEKIDHFRPSRIARVALLLQRADASPMFSPLMLPKRLSRPAVTGPVRGHVAQQRSGPVGLEDGGDVGVLPGGVTSCVIATVAAVGPVQGERVSLCVVNEDGGKL